MRVLHLVHQPRYSGAELLVSGLTEVHAAMGHVSLVASYSPSEQDFMEVIYRQKVIGVPWVCSDKFKKKFARIEFLAGVEREFRPDVVFAHSEIPALYARLAGLKHVISVLHSQTNFQSPLTFAAEAVLQFRSAGVVSVSEVARSNYATRFRRPPTKYIANGVDLGRFRFSSAARGRVRRELGISCSDRVVLQVGRLSRVKRQHLTLAAITPLIRADANLRLIFAGISEDPLYQGELVSEVARRGVARNVHFLGGRQDVADLLSAADLFVMPSEIEAQGIALVEALAAGLPIVGARIDGFAFARDMEGVNLLDPERLSNFQKAIAAGLNIGFHRFERPLPELDIHKTASAYLEFANRCID